MMQESLDFVRKVSDPASAASWQAVADLAGRWSSRWPSMQQGSSAAALTVIYSRDIALQSVAAELAKTAQVPHKVIPSRSMAQSRLLCHWTIYIRSGVQSTADRLIAEGLVDHIRQRRKQHLEHLVRVGACPRVAASTSA